MIEKLTLPDAHNSKHQKAQVAAGVKDKACPLELTKFYIAEVIIAVEYLHNNVRNHASMFAV